MTNSRVNARLDVEGERHLEYLVETTGLSVSDVIKTSLSYHYAAQRKLRPARLANLRPFVGQQVAGAAMSPPT